MDPLLLAEDELLDEEWLELDDEWLLPRKNEPPELLCRDDHELSALS
jgi:hypothetical protein